MTIGFQGLQPAAWRAFFIACLVEWLVGLSNEAGIYQQLRQPVEFYGITGITTVWLMRCLCRDSSCPLG